MFPVSFPVTISSELYGDCIGICHNITPLSIVVSMSYRPPKETELIVHFVNEQCPDAMMSARAEVAGVIEDGHGDELVYLRKLAFFDFDAAQLSR